MEEACLIARKGIKGIGNYTCRSNEHLELLSSFMVILMMMMGIGILVFTSGFLSGKMVSVISVNVNGRGVDM